jgi:hypothetical protein
VVVSSQKSKAHNKTKEAIPMDKKAVIIHISRILETLPEDSIRAVYMVTRQMHELHAPHNEDIMN